MKIICIARGADKYSIPEKLKTVQQKLKSRFAAAF